MSIKWTSMIETTITGTLPQYTIIVKATDRDTGRVVTYVGAKYLSREDAEQMMPQWIRMCKNKRKAEYQKEIREAMRSLGMKRVRGGLGGVYYE